MWLRWSIWASFSLIKAHSMRTLVVGTHHRWSIWQTVSFFLPFFLSKYVLSSTVFAFVWPMSHHLCNFLYTVFSFATSFNQPIGYWDVSNVKSMQSMFSGATSFNQAIGEWDVSGVKDMSYSEFCIAFQILPCDLKTTRVLMSSRYIFSSHFFLFHGSIW